MVSPDLASPSPSRAAAPETPFFFESDDRPCYAVAHAPARARQGAAALVMVHSLGVEQQTLYRQEVLVARAAAELGVPVLRYHARGHGDSAGDFADVALPRLVADASHAAAEAKRRFGSTRVVWLGVRFGALVAALAAKGRDDTAAIALWEPVLKAPDHFRAQLRFLLFSRIAGGIRPEATADQLLAQAREQGEVDVNGYLLHRAILESSEGATLAGALAGTRVPVLLAQVQQRAKLAPGFEALAASLGEGGAAVTTALISEEPGYQNGSNPSWESPPLTQAIMEWLDAVA